MGSENSYKVEQSQYKYRISRDNIFSPDRFGNNFLHQVGRMHLREGATIGEHMQLNYFELTIATEGRGRVETNGESVQIGAGDIHLSFAGDIHSDEKHPLKYDYITVQTADERLFSEMEGIVERHHAATSRVIRDDEICHLVGRAISETQNPHVYSEVVLESIINQIFVLVIRDFKAMHMPERSETGDESKILCYKLMNYIDNHIYTIRNLAELAKITNYSYNYLSNLFKDTTGDTLRSYYQNRRLETAALLLEDDFSVTEIAGMLGYSSVYPLSLAFKKRYGYPPSAVRKRKQANDGEEKEI